MFKYLKRKLINWVLNSVIKGFDYEEVWDNLTPEDKDKLSDKAKTYFTDDFYTEFDKMIENLALNKMGRDSVGTDEMMFAKMVLWYHQTRRTKLKEIINWKKVDPNQPDKKW